MSPALTALARQLAAHPRWRWLPGMAAIESAAPGMALTDGRPVRVDATWASVGLWIPDLDDLVTAAALLPLAREVWGAPYACAVGGRAYRWAVWRSAFDYDAWAQGSHDRKCEPLTGLDEDGAPIRYDTEVEALAAVILRGGE